MHIPTVIKTGTLDFRINTKEKNHRGRPHCHIVGAGAECSVDLVSFEVLASKGFSKTAVSRIVEEVKKYQVDLLEVWNEIHGEEK
jgi:hypothetical protein